MTTVTPDHVTPSRLVQPLSDSPAMVTIPPILATHAGHRVSSAIKPHEISSPFENKLDSILALPSYFDTATLAQEQQRLFAPAAQYVGSAVQVPAAGDYVVTTDGTERVLVNDAGVVRLLSNVCRHRQATILKGSGNTTQIVCPLHRWTYDLSGQLLGAPHFAQKPCAHLATATDLRQWRGLYFAGQGAAALAQALGRAQIDSSVDFSGYRWQHTEQHLCQYNWKTFIEVYLEDYHVEPFHPGLGGFVACSDLAWQFAPHYSVQTVSYKSQLTLARTPAYQRWQRAATDFFGTQLPGQGVVWLLLYPNIMVEYYPGVLTVSTLIPQGPQQTLNVVDFFYLEEIALFEPELMAAQQAAYCETMIEDDEIALRMDAGRRALVQQGLEQHGPYQSPMEDGMRAFHQWYRQQMA